MFLDFCYIVCIDNKSTLKKVSFLLQFVPGQIVSLLDYTRYQGIFTRL